MPYRERTPRRLTARAVVLGPADSQKRITRRASKGSRREPEPAENPSRKVRPLAAVGRTRPVLRLSYNHPPPDGKRAASPRFSTIPTGLSRRGAARTRRRGRPCGPWPKQRTSRRRARPGGLTVPRPTQGPEHNWDACGENHDAHEARRRIPFRPFSSQAPNTASARERRHQPSQQASH
jgi:hypothetical protein